jgi:uncharacterized protein (TIGR02246 family)
MKIQPALSLLLTSSAFLIASCAPSAPIDNSTISAAAAIRTLDEQWSAAAARKDLTATVAFYADDAVLLPPNAPIATDRKSIRDSWAALLDQGATVSWKVSKAEVAKSGELGYLYGTYQLSISDPKGGPPASDTGKLVEIWKKQEDGRWRCIVDTYNSDLPVPGATETKK